MSKLLAIFVSPRGEYSVSTTLTAQFVEAWKKNHAGGEVITRDLQKTKLPFVDMPWIGGAYTPAEQHSPEMAAAVKIGNDLIAELKEADHIVIGTPMYNFSTPAILKAYIDHIVRFGVTFNASYEGLLKGKKTTIIVASGGVYTPGAYMEGYNFETGYLKHILGFIGLSDINFILAGGSNDVAQGKISQQDLVAQFVPQVVEAAA